MKTSERIEHLQGKFYGADAIPGRETRRVIRLDLLLAELQLNLEQAAGYDGDEEGFEAYLRELRQAVDVSCRPAVDPPTDDAERMFDDAPSNPPALADREAWGKRWRKLAEHSSTESEYLDDALSLLDEYAASALVAFDREASQYLHRLEEPGWMADELRKVARDVLPEVAPASPITDADRQALAIGRAAMGAAPESVGELTTEQANYVQDVVGSPGRLPDADRERIYRRFEARFVRDTVARLMSAKCNDEHCDWPHAVRLAAKEALGPDAVAPAESFEVHNLDMLAEMLRTTVIGQEAKERWRNAVREVLKRTVLVDAKRAEAEEVERLRARVAELEGQLEEERAETEEARTLIRELQRNALPTDCTHCNGSGVEPPGCPQSDRCEWCGGWTANKQIVATDRKSRENGIKFVLDEVVSPSTYPIGGPDSLMRRAWELGRERLDAVRRVESAERERDAQRTAADEAENAMREANVRNVGLLDEIAALKADRDTALANATRWKEEAGEARAEIQRRIAVDAREWDHRSEFWKSASLKGRQLEREIRDSDATNNERSDMLHTLSKLMMFASDAATPRTADRPEGATAPAEPAQEAAASDTGPVDDHRWAFEAMRGLADALDGAAKSLRSAMSGAEKAGG